VVKARAAELRAKGTLALSRFLGAHAGSEVELLVEHDGLGRTRQFAEMRLAEPVAAGAIVRARVSGHDGQRLAGEVVA
jgi:threonylcarbamoyladenosine tRNA methylthiotransferase MtaB